MKSQAGEVWFEADEKEPIPTQGKLLCFSIVEITPVLEWTPLRLSIGAE